MSAEKVETLAHRIVGCSGGCTASHYREVHSYNVEPWASLLLRAQEVLRRYEDADDVCLLLADLDAALKGTK